MTKVFLWNLLAWFAWGLLILGIRFAVERKNQKIVEQEAEEALRA